MTPCGLGELRKLQKGEKIKTGRRESSVFKPKISVLRFYKIIKGHHPATFIFIINIY